MKRIPFFVALPTLILLSFISLLNAVALKDKTGNLSFEFLDLKIPQSYEQVASKKFPSNIDIELDFSGFREGSTLGPDGGEVYRWKEGIYKWNFKDGGELTYWSPSNWLLTKNQSQFHVYSDNGQNLPKNFRFVFPNESILSQFYQKAFQVNFYFVEDFKNLLFYQLFPDKLFASRFKIKKRFHFHFEPEHEAWIDAFVEGEAYDRFESYIKEIGYSSSKQIPVIFFKKEKQFRDYINIPNADCAGGRGGIFGLSFCNVNPVLGYIGSDEDEIKKSRAIHHTHMLYHEWGHHLQQVECAIVRKNQQYPTQSFSAWFNEGMAEYLGYIGSSKKRGNDHIQFFEKYVLTGKQPNLTKEDPYLLGGQLFRFIAQSYGDKAILKLWSDSCKGIKEEVLIKNLTSLSPQEFLNAYIKYLSQYKDEPKTTSYMRLVLEDWAKDILVLNFIHRDPRLPDLTDKNMKPNLKYAFQLDVDSIRGKLEGQFTNPRQEQIYLFKDGTYTIKGPDYNATVYQNETIVYQSQGHQITEWANGSISWKDSNGKTYSF